MKELIDLVPVKNLRHGEFEWADLFRGIDEQTLRSIDTDWQPSFLSAPPRHRPEDAHWQWALKALSALKNPLAYELFSVEKDGKTQGMMMVAKGGPDCFSRHPEHPRAPIIYIEFLATAPWNRQKLSEAPVYKGVGRILFMAAVSLSFDEGLAGRIGLHSLQGAEAFYRDRLLMTDMSNDDSDSHQGLRYFELSASQACQLIGRGLSNEKVG